MSSLNPLNWSKLTAALVGAVGFAAAVAYLEYARAAKKSAKIASAESKGASGKAAAPLLDVERVASGKGPAAPAHSAHAASGGGVAAGAELSDGGLDFNSLSPDQQMAIQYWMTLQQQGQAMMERQQFDEALKFFTMGVEMLKTGLGSEHMMVAEALYELAQLAPALGDPDAAIRHHQDGHRIRVANLGPTHALVGESHIKLAQMLHELGQDTLAATEISAAKTVLSLGDPKRPEMRINVASADIIGAEISASLEQFERALEQANAARATFIELMPGTILASHAAAITATIHRDCSAWAAAEAEYRTALASISGDENANVVYKLTNDLHSLFLDCGEVAKAAEHEATMLAAPLVGAPLTESRLLKTRFAAIQPFASDDASAEPRVHYVLVLSPRAGQWKRLNPAGSDAFVEIAMQSTNAAREPVSQTAVVTMANVADARAKIVMQSPPFANPVFGVYKVTVRVFLDEARTNCIGTHVQFVAYHPQSNEANDEDATEAGAGAA